MATSTRPHNPITFIYFDIGGVLIDDFSNNDKWQALKTELGVTAEKRAAFEQLWSQYEPEIVTTRNVETLVPILRQKLTLDIPTGYSLLQAFTNRFHANPSIWPAVEVARQKARVGLLTNMYPCMFATLEARNILPSIEWDTVIDSSLEGLAKPDEKLFALAEQRATAHGQQILFIDNSPGHVSAAEQFGWQAYLYDSSDHVVSSERLATFIAKLAV